MFLIQILYYVNQLPISLYLTIDCLSQILLRIFSLQVIKEFAGFLLWSYWFWDFRKSEMRSILINFQVRFEHSNFILEPIHFFFKLFNVRFLSVSTFLSEYPVSFSTAWIQISLPSLILLRLWVIWRVSLRSSRLFKLFLCSSLHPTNLICGLSEKSARWLSRV